MLTLNFASAPVVNMNHWTSVSWRETEPDASGETAIPSNASLSLDLNSRTFSHVSSNDIQEKERTNNSFNDLENLDTTLESHPSTKHPWNSLSPSIPNHNSIPGSQYSANFTNSYQNSPMHPQKPPQGNQASFLLNYPSVSESASSSSPYLEQQQHYHQFAGAGYPANQPENSISLQTYQQQMYSSNSGIPNQTSTQSQHGYFQNLNYHTLLEQSVPVQWEIYHNPKQLDPTTNNQPTPLSTSHAAHLNQIQPPRSQYYSIQDLSSFNAQFQRRPSSSHSLPRPQRRTSISPPNSKYSSSTSSSPVNSRMVISGMNGSYVSKSVTKRSRMGCLTCRQRKKRCSENRPKCTECSRLRLNCVWPKPGTEYKNKNKDAKEEDDTIHHEIYGKIKILRGIVEYKIS